MRTHIDRLRSFNRAVTRRIGALDDSYLARGRPLGEARVLFEVGSGEPADLSELRDRLGLDSGYLSRLLRSLERQGLIEVRRKADDGRAREVVLTGRGKDEVVAYDSLSDDLAESILSSLTQSQRDRLVAAAGEVERLLKAASIRVQVEPAGSAEARRCLDQYFAELARRFENGFEIGPAGGADPAAMSPPKGWFVIARLDGRPVGCGALKRLDATTGEIKRVWCDEDARGMGVATRIVDCLETLARDAGFDRVRLDTNRVLTEAHALYRKRGYAEIARYNDNPYAHHWFEKQLRPVQPAEPSDASAASSRPGR
jgi:DNA-binding MarR family transcriptional regulator